MINILLFSAFIIGLVWLSFRRIISTRRTVHCNNLDRIYDRMEYYIATEKIELSPAAIRFFKSYKNLVVNPEFADIQVLVMLTVLSPNKNLSTRRVEFESIKKSLPAPIISLAEKFDSEVRSLINLSMFRPNFVYLIVKIISLTIYEHGIMSLPNYFRRLMDVINHETITAPRVVTEANLC